MLLDLTDVHKKNGIKKDTQITNHRYELNGWKED
jgi:hypothetical protein